RPSRGRASTPRPRTAPESRRWPRGRRSFGHPGREQFQGHPELARGNQMAVIPEDVPEGGRVTLGAQLAAVVGAKQGPGEDFAALVAQLLEAQVMVDVAVLEESDNTVQHHAD